MQRPPQYVMQALVNSPPRKPDEWRFMQDFKRQQEAERTAQDTDSDNTKPPGQTRAPAVNFQGCVYYSI